MFGGSTGEREPSLDRRGAEDDLVRLFARRGESGGVPESAGMAIGEPRFFKSAAFVDGFEVGRRLTGTWSAALAGRLGVLKASVLEELPVGVPGGGGGTVDGMDPPGGWHGENRGPRADVIAE